MKIADEESHVIIGTVITPYLDNKLRNSFLIFSDQELSDPNRKSIYKIMRLDPRDRLMVDASIASHMPWLLFLVHKYFTLYSISNHQIFTSEKAPLF